MIVPKLTTMAACRAVGLSRDRFNEYVHAGQYDCAPATVAGRARLFTPDDLLGLKLFKQNLDDGMPPKIAGEIACDVMAYAKQYPDEPVIGILTAYIGIIRAVKPSEVPPMDLWTSVAWSGSTIRKVDYFNVAHLRALIEHAIEEERSIIGEADA